MSFLKKAFWLIILTFFPVYISPVTAKAEVNKYVTIVNPVRISSYTKSSASSINGEYKVVKDLGLKATWLLTYDVLTNEEAVKAVKNMNENQEIGLFFEVTKNYAKDSDISYNDTGYWHHATALFLSGYVQDERKKLINTIFEKFKSVFGYYPTSVGSWWTDSFSLGYMKEKYGITANLTCADQFSMDGYQIWGQYWSMPFYPSKFHAGIPASSEKDKIDVVTIQWAERDPFNGYYSSLYSTQDYFTQPGLKTDYFESLVDLYLENELNPFSQITLGLEGDFDAGSYEKEYLNQMRYVKQKLDSGKIQLMTMGEFANFYLNNFSGTSPEMIMANDDLLGSSTRSYWYQSPLYRVGIFYDRKSTSLKIVDWRIYSSYIKEPYYDVPNRDFTLSINTPSLVNAIDDQKNFWVINFGQIIKEEKTDNIFILEFSDGKIEFYKNKIVFEGKNVSYPDFLRKTDYARVNSSKNRLEVTFQNKWTTGVDGFSFKDLTLEATHFIKGRKVQLAAIGAVLLFLGVGFLIQKRGGKYLKLVYYFVLFCLSFTLVKLYGKYSTTYFVSPDEVSALSRLSLYPAGKVLVVDKECLQCEWHSKFRPAVFANKRSYVSKISKQKMVYGNFILETKNSSEIVERIKKLKIKYVYLVRYENYSEKISFSPGDLDIEKIYSNANAELWKVKN
jgi:hypothetical protein